LVAVNTPDKIIFVGEALVGNEAVDQLTKFDRALRDFSSASGAGKGRGIDGMLVTKWDTVDDKVGSVLSKIPHPHQLYSVGWRGAVHDLCDGATHHLCRLRAGERDSVVCHVSRVADHVA
jgi:hypothetical protein